jgi:hypothetical protein
MSDTDASIDTNINRLTINNDISKNNKKNSDNLLTKTNTPIKVTNNNISNSNLLNTKNISNNQNNDISATKTNTSIFDKNVKFHNGSTNIKSIKSNNKYNKSKFRNNNNKNGNRSYSFNFNNDNNEINEITSNNTTLNKSSSINNLDLNKSMRFGTSLKIAPSLPMTNGTKNM